MKYSWNLKDLYPKKEDFYYDMTLIRDKIKKISEYREIKVDGNSLYELMCECFKIREINFKTLLYASLNYYLDINNSSFLKMKEQAEELDCFVRNETNFIDELISIIDEDKFNEFYQECPNLNKYSYYINNVKRLGKHIITDNYDNINKISLEINKNIVNYNNLFSDMNFGSIDGNKINNTNIGIYLVCDDRDLRKRVFNNMNQSYKERGSDYFTLFNSLIVNRKKIADLKKYSSVLESELYDEDIRDELINNLIDSVNNNIFLMNRYLKLKMKYLEIDNPKLYDINLSIVENKDSFELDNAFDILTNAFNIFGDDYLKTMHYLIENNHLDLECNSNKHPSIVFSWNTYSFMNYKNRYIDLKNLAHELGHIINCYLASLNQPYIYNDSTVFTGEIASLVNEILLNEYLYEKASDKGQKIFYLTKIIENFISQVYRQTMYTEFENLIYNNNKLSLDFVNDVYLSLIKKYYGSVIDIDDDIACEWMRVGHLFRWSYYVYKYATGYILAFNVVKKFKEKDYINNYLDFLSSGCSCSNEELLKKLDIDLYDEDLINNSFNLLNDYLSKLEDLLGGDK